MARFLYTEVDVVCILVLFMLLFNVTGKQGALREEKMFVKLLGSMMLLLSLDALWSCVDGLKTLPLVWLNYALCALFFGAGAVACFMWFRYCCIKIKAKFVFDRGKMLISFLPVVLLIVSVVLSFKYNIIFYIDSANVYHRGSLHFLQIIIAYGYIAAAFVIALCRGIKTDDREIKHDCFYLMKISAMPLFGAIIQSYFPGYPIMWASSSLALVAIFLGLQNRQIMLDGLTAVNNRRSFGKYLDQSISDKRNEGALYLILVDIDGFKGINDTYGHLAGDNALVTLAMLRQKLCNKSGDFLARFGGDEFAIVCERSDMYLVRQFTEEINFELVRLNRDAKLRCEMTVSTGIALFEHYGTTQDDLIAAADENLYEMKRQKRRLH